MSLATQFQSDVNTFLTDIGRAMTLRRITAGTYDVTTGITSGDTSTDYAGYGRIGDYSDRARDGTIIKEGDRRVTFMPTNTAIAPQVGDRLVVGSDTYAIVNFQTREIGGTVAEYTLQIRK